MFIMTKDGDYINVNEIRGFYINAIRNMKDEHGNLFSHARVMAALKSGWITDAKDAEHEVVIYDIICYGNGYAEDANGIKVSEAQAKAAHLLDGLIDIINNKRRLHISDTEMLADALKRGDLD